MAYIQPTLLSMTPEGDFPLTLPDSGGVYFYNPGGESYWELRFKDGRVAHYHENGDLWPNFPNYP